MKYLVLSAILAILTVHLPQGVDAACGDYSSCSTCVAKVSSEGCAWCKGSNSCGLPNPFSCPDTVVLSGQCPGAVQCSAYTNCGSCVGKFATATCTWCNTTQKCTSALEVVGKCSTPAIAQSVCNAYTGNVCVDQTNCSSCASKFASHTCTWCHATKKCDSAFNSLTCTSAAVSEDICVAYSGSACTNHSSCSTCVGGFARDSCTWCNSSQTCNSAINSLSCQINAVAEPVCTALAWKNCGVYADCFDCTAQATSGCGWCNSSNTCFHLQSGTCAGSVGTSGSGIVITNLQCPGQTPMPMGLPTEAECASHGSTCGLCVGKQGCVYCATSNKCLVVTDADCSPDSMKMTSDMCTAITACPSKTTCGNCTANMQDLCAWCSTTSKCQPMSNQCDSPLMAAAQCPNAKAACQDHTGCGSCLAEVSGCAWCKGECDLAFDLATCGGVVAMASSCPATTPSPPTSVPPTPAPTTTTTTAAPTTTATPTPTTTTTTATSGAIATVATSAGNQGQNTELIVFTVTAKGGGTISYTEKQTILGKVATKIGVAVSDLEVVANSNSGELSFRVTGANSGTAVAGLISYQSKPAEMDAMGLGSMGYAAPAPTPAPADEGLGDLALGIIIGSSCLVVILAVAMGIFVMKKKGGDGSPGKPTEMQTKKRGGGGGATCPPNEGATLAVLSQPLTQQQNPVAPNPVAPKSNQPVEDDLFDL